MLRALAAIPPVVTRLSLDEPVVGLGGAPVVGIIVGLGNALVVGTIVGLGNALVVGSCIGQMTKSFPFAPSCVMTPASSPVSSLKTTRSGPGLARWMSTMGD